MVHIITRNGKNGKTERNVKYCIFQTFKTSLKNTSKNESKSIHYTYQTKHVQQQENKPAVLHSLFLHTRYV